MKHNNAKGHSGEGISDARYKDENGRGGSTTKSSLPEEVVSNVSSETAEMRGSKDSDKNSNYFG